MAQTLKQLMDQRAELDRQIQEAQHRTRSDAIAQVRQIMHDNGLTLADLSTRQRQAPTSRAGGGKVAPKYHDKAGNTWSGRGLKPKWLQAALAGGGKLQDFAI